MNPQTQAEAKSDELDKKLLAVPHKVVDRTRFFLALILAALTLITVAVTAQFYFVINLASDNHQVLTEQIPILRRQVDALEKQLVERNKTVARQRVELDDSKAILDQAIAAIVKMAGQMEAAGLKPPRIVLKPPKHP